MYKYSLECFWRGSGDVAVCEPTSSLDVSDLKSHVSSDSVEAVV